MLYIVTGDSILADFVRQEVFPLPLTVTPDTRTLPPDAAVIVDTAAVKPPYPPGVLLQIARDGTAQNDTYPVLYRPLVPGEIPSLLHTAENAVTVRPLEGGGAIVLRGAASAALTPPEADLYVCLSAGTSNISRETLCAILRTRGTAGDPNALLTVYIHRLRRKLAPLGMTLTAGNGGYLLQKET